MTNRGSHFRFYYLLILIPVGLLALLLGALCGGTGCYVPSEEGWLIFQLRAPRVASAFAVGGLLSLAGALMQLLLRTPLADPYVLGVSGGAAAGALSFSLLLPATVFSQALCVVRYWPRHYCWFWLDAVCSTRSCWIQVQAASG